MYVAFECFILQVQTAGVGAHEDGQGQARPPTCGGGAGRRRRCRKEAQVAWAVVEEAGASLPDGLEDTGAASVWKRQGGVIRAAWTADLKRAIRIRARETELARAAHEYELTGWSSYGRPDVRTLVLS